jgi:hypothetical protein
MSNVKHLPTVSEVVETETATRFVMSDGQEWEMSVVGEAFGCPLFHSNHREAGESLEDGVYGREVSSDGEFQRAVGLGAYWAQAERLKAEAAK